MAYILAYDIGTTGIKTCLFRLKDKISLIAAASEGYELYTFPDGGAEQRTSEWWDAMCKSTMTLFEKTEVKPEQIDGITFCSQMQGLVLVDENGKEVRNPMSYMDQRASEEMRKGMCKGFRISGMNARKLMKSLKICGTAPGSAKDPIWRYHWVKNHEPDNFHRVRWWLDVKEYLIGRMTGEFVMTDDSAFATALYDTEKRCWSKELINLYDIDSRYLPKVIKTTDIVGGLKEEAARELGLIPGTSVYGGGGDASLIGVGAGSVGLGDTHIYCGTSGWVSTVTDKKTTDIDNLMSAIVGAQDNSLNYFAEMETAGKSLEWVKDHLALDEIGIYIRKQDVTGDRETIYESLYDYMSEVIERCPPGAGGVIFAPWLHGNRCPFEDHNASGMFFNLKLDTGKTEMIRAVTEGVCYHLRWMLECQEKKVKTSETIRFVGGGALSPVTCQILADITGRVIETVDSPQNAGSAGAALTAAVGMGMISDMSKVKDLIQTVKSYRPRAEYADIYEKNYKVFINLYRSNKKNFLMINE